MALSSQHSPMISHAIKEKSKFHTTLHKALGSLPTCTLPDLIFCWPPFTPNSLDHLPMKIQWALGTCSQQGA